LVGAIGGFSGLKSAPTGPEVLLSWDCPCAAAGNKGRVGAEELDGGGSVLGGIVVGGAPLEFGGRPGIGGPMPG